MLACSVRNLITFCTSDSIKSGLMKIAMDCLKEAWKNHAKQYYVYTTSCFPSVVRGTMANPIVIMAEWKKMLRKLGMLIKSPNKQSHFSQRSNCETESFNLKWKMNLKDFRKIKTEFSYLIWETSLLPIV